MPLVRLGYQNSKHLKTIFMDKSPLGWCKQESISVNIRRGSALKKGHFFHFIDHVRVATKKYTPTLQI